MYISTPHSSPGSNSTQICHIFSVSFYFFFLIHFLFIVLMHSTGLFFKVCICTLSLYWRKWLFHWGIKCKWSMHLVKHPTEAPRSSRVPLLSSLPVRSLLKSEIDALTPAWQLPDRHDTVLSPRLTSKLIWWNISDEKQRPHFIYSFVLSHRLSQAGPYLHDEVPGLVYFYSIRVSLKINRLASIICDEMVYMTFLNIFSVATKWLTCFILKALFIIKAFDFAMTRFPWKKHYLIDSLFT